MDASAQKNIKNGSTGMKNWAINSIQQVKMSLQ
jgi:hypothetical protein